MPVEQRFFIGMDLSKIRWATDGAIAVLLVYLVLYQPQWLFSLLHLATPNAAYRIDTNEKIIALTIDDGPHPNTTEQILEVLERHGAQATFFVLSRRLEHQPAIGHRLIDLGHELGHHMTVDEASIGLSRDEFARKFDLAHRQISPYGHRRWFRPGMGWYRPSMITHARRRGYCLVLGSLFPYDTHIPLVRFGRWFVLQNLTPGDILVLHDGPKGRGERTAALLDQLLPAMKARGYQMVSLSAAAQKTDSLNTGCL